MSDGIESLEVSVMNLIKRFIGRQAVTFDAFQALRPALIEADHKFPQEFDVPLLRFVKNKYPS